MADPVEPLTPSYHATSAAPLISLDVAKWQLKITETDRDDEITHYAAQATDTILDYLKHGADPAWTVDTVPLPVAAAIQVMLTHLWEDKGDEQKDTLATSAERTWQRIDLMLARFRDPALA